MKVGAVVGLVVSGVAHSYGRKEALRGVSLRLGDGVTGLVGANGAGKSTLLTIVAGGLKPTEGSVTIGGDDVYGRRSRRSALPRVALMPQSFSFPKAMTAVELVAYLTWMRGVPWKTARVRAREALEQVHLAGVADARMDSLSGGMARRVCLAQALATRPELLLLDEPSTGLDPEQRRVMVDLLADLRGVQVLMSSHVLEDITDVADTVVVLHEGRVAFEGTTADLVARAFDPTSHKAAEQGFLAIVAEQRGAAT